MPPITNNLLILSRDAEKYYEIINDHNLPDIQITAFTDPADALKRCRRSNIVFGDPDLIRQILSDTANLSWVQSSWAGVEPLLGHHCRNDYLLTGVKGVFGHIITEYVLCHMLSYEQKTQQRYESQKINQWNDAAPGTLRQKTIGIMGVGSIGAAIARSAKHFGMITIGYTMRNSGCEYIDEYFHGDQIYDFVTILDYLVCVLPDTHSTKNIINRSIFKAMKK